MQLKARLKAQNAGSGLSIVKTNAQESSKRGAAFGRPCGLPWPGESRPGGAAAPQTPPPLLLFCALVDWNAHIRIHTRASN